MMQFHECKTNEEKLKYVKETVSEWCFPDGEDEDAIDYRIAVVLIAAMVIGTNIDNLTALTGYPREFVADVSSRARSTGLWVEGGVCYEHWFKGNSVSSVPILCDVLVIEGQLTRRRREDGKFLYSYVGPSC